MKNYLSSLSPVHSRDEEQEPMPGPTEAETPYLPQTDKKSPVTGPAKTVISADVVINGSLSASTDLDIFGTVKGNITTSGAFLLAGLVEGNVKAREFHFSKAHLKGDITADELVVLEDDTVIEGDIQTRDFILDGKLDGNVKASGSVTLKHTAVLSGDIETSSLEVSKGAVINGAITFTKK